MLEAVEALPILTTQIPNHMGTDAAHWGFIHPIVA